MKRILHIRTRKEDPLATAAIAEQQKQSEVTIQTFDLTRPQPDYDELLKQIFEADAVHVW